MNKNKRGFGKGFFIVGLIFVLVFVGSVSATTYYVNTTGNNVTGDGSESNPWLNINHAVPLLSAGDVLIIKYGIYNEGIDIGATGISGTSNNPITVRGESNSLRPILNGSNASQTNGVGFTGEDYWTIQYFHIFNFSQDGFNVHNAGADPSIGILFQNSTINQSQTGEGGNGDGISFHEECSGSSEWINIYDVKSEGIVDIQNAVTNYSNIYIELNNPSEEGIFFTMPTATITQHYLNNITVKNARACLRTDGNRTIIINNLTCIDNTGIHQIYASGLNININITNFNITDSGGQKCSYIGGGGSTGYFFDGYCDNGFSVWTGNNTLYLTNVTNAGTNTFSGSEGRLYNQWWYRAYVNNTEGNIVSSANVTIYNVSGDYQFNLTTNPTGYTPIKEIIDYVNVGGTKTYYSNYTIYSINSSYLIINHTYNVTSNENNLKDVFTFDATPPTPTFSCSPTSVNTGQTITCSCTATDNVDSSPSVSFTTNPSTSSTGTFTTTCTATDDAGNSAISSVSYSVSSSGGGISSPPFYKHTFVQNDKEFSEIKTIEKELKIKERIRIKINNEEHHVGVKEIKENSAIIEIASEPILIELNIGEDAKVNVNKDNYYDVYVKLNNITNSKANLIINYLHEEIPEENKGSVETSGKIIDEEEIFEEAEKKNKLWLGISIGVLIVFVVGLVVKWKKNKKKKK